MQNLDELKKSFHNFNEVKDDEIRVWNRCAMVFNTGSKSPAQMREYLGQFNTKEMDEIRGMFSRIKKNGYESTRREIMRANSQKPHEELEHA